MEPCVFKSHSEIKWIKQNKIHDVQKFSENLTRVLIISQCTMWIKLENKINYKLFFANDELKFLTKQCLNMNTHLAQKVMNSTQNICYKRKILNKLREIIKQYEET